MSQKPLWVLFREAHASADNVLEHFNIIRPPIPIEKIVQGMGTFLVPVANPGWSAAVKATEHQSIIWFDANESLPRRRFAIAHELGHLLLHPLDEAYRDDSFVGDPKQEQANGFAADLLMPYWMIDHFASFGKNDVENLAMLFSVSEYMMRRRLLEMIGVEVSKTAPVENK